jgi:hypothetical protein
MHLPLDVDVYVLGVVGENGCIGAPPAGAKGQRFPVSVKSEETRAAELGSASEAMLGFGVACLVGAVLSLESGRGSVAGQGGTQSAEFPAERAPRAVLVVSHSASWRDKSFGPWRAP